MTTLVQRFRWILWAMVSVRVAPFQQSLLPIRAFATVAVALQSLTYSAQNRHRL